MCSCTLGGDAESICSSVDAFDKKMKADKDTKDAVQAVEISGDIQNYLPVGVSKILRGGGWHLRKLFLARTMA